MFQAERAPGLPLSNNNGGLHQHATWSPYDNNGGRSLCLMGERVVMEHQLSIASRTLQRTVVAVAGNDYCIVAGSTRLSTGYSILTRERSMITSITPQVVIAAAGFEADASTLKKVIQRRNVTYQHNHKKPMSVAAAAQLVGNTLYYKRFFPYYSFTLVAGLDTEALCEQGMRLMLDLKDMEWKRLSKAVNLSQCTVTHAGKGAVYSYDAVGSHERVGYGCQGSGSDLIQPVLDNQLKASSPLVLPQENWMSSLPLEEAVDLVKSAFVSAGERDIYTGDQVEIIVMTKEGSTKERFDLKKD